MYEKFITLNTDPSWHKILHHALAQMDQDYLYDLIQDSDWLPGMNAIFNAFSLPRQKINYILFGESPYPRAQSANGYAFWDAAVDNIWSETGLAKPVNRATSLRNIIKMLLVAEGKLTPNNSTQSEIAKIKKTIYINRLPELFNNFSKNGVMMLNATLVYQNGKIRYHSKYWLAFINSLLTQIQSQSITLILFGKIAQIIDKLTSSTPFEKIYAEHPYNLSFISNPDVIQLFQPMNLLRAE